MAVEIMGFQNHVIGEPFETNLKEPYFMYYLYEIARTKGFPNWIDENIKCTSCKHVNLVYGPYHPRLMSAFCMECAQRLLCPYCLYPLREGLITNFDSVLFCNDCSIWFPI